MPRLVTTAPLRTGTRKPPELSTPGKYPIVRSRAVVPDGRGGFKADKYPETVTVDLAYFLRANRDDRDVARWANALKVGEWFVTGGGAAPLFEVWRIR